MTNETDTSAMLDHALAYARAGLRVIPCYGVDEIGCRCADAMDCKSPGKHPIPQAWQKKGTTDEPTIRAWWNCYPWANIGIVTGGDVAVLDFDVADDPSWPHEIRAMREADTWISRTGRSGGVGRHVWLTKPSGVYVRPKGGAHSPWPGVDIRAENAFVVVPPSMHSSGARYQWVNDLSFERASIPDEILTAIAGGDPASVEAGSTAPVLTGPAWNTLDPRQEAELRSALAALDASPRDQWVDMACAMKSTGAGEQAYAIWRDWSATCEDKFSERECRKLWSTVHEVRSGTTITTRTLFHRAHEAGWSESQVTLDDVEDVASDGATGALLEVEDLWAGDAREPDWLIDDVLGVGEWLILFGPSSSGKTFVALDICGKIAHGLRIWGNDVKASHVLYVTGEGGIGLRNRVKAWQQGHDEMPADAMEHRKRFDRCDMPELSTEEGYLKLHTTLLKARADGRPYGLVVLDTLSWALGGLDENKASDVAQVSTRVRRLRAEFGCAFLVIHHSGKGEGSTKTGMQAMRGSSAIHSNVDNVVQVRRGSGGLVNVYVAKVKEGESGASHDLEFIPVPLGRSKKGKPYGSAWLRERPKEQPQAKPSEVDADLRFWVTHLLNVEHEHPDGWTKRDLHEEVPPQLTQKKVRALIPAATAEGFFDVTEDTSGGRRPSQVHKLSERARALLEGDNK